MAVFDDEHRVTDAAELAARITRKDDRWNLCLLALVCHLDTGNRIARLGDNDHRVQLVTEVAHNGVCAQVFFADYNTRVAQQLFLQIFGKQRRVSLGLNADKSLTCQNTEKISSFCMS